MPQRSVENTQPDASSKRFIGYTGTRGDKSLGGLARPQVGVRSFYRKAGARGTA
ncbi:hypothetical protein LEMLEM_LOCUS14244 [Lemmus lemmus]